MAKVTLGKRPKSFHRKVEFKMVDGEDAELTLLFKYRTKREFGALIDEMVQQPQQSAAADASDQLPLLPEAGAAGQEPHPEPEQPAKIPQLSEFMAASIDAQADYILKIAEGWDIPDTPFDRKHVTDFCDEQPGGVKAVMAAYREAITEGRLGN